MKTALVICQYHENYGAHDWDGKGACPQYWKAKGSIDHIFTNVPDDWTTAQVASTVSKTVEHSNDYSQTYIIGVNFVEANHLTESEGYQMEDYGVIKWPAPRTDINTLIQ